MSKLAVREASLQLKLRTGLIYKTETPAPQGYCRHENIRSRTIVKRVEQFFIFIVCGALLIVINYIAA